MAGDLSEKIIDRLKQPEAALARNGDCSALLDQDPPEVLAKVAGNWWELRIPHDHCGDVDQTTDSTLALVDGVF